MKVTILKYLSTKGKILEIKKNNFRGRDLPKNIIEEYEIEIEGEEVIEKPLEWYEVKSNFPMFLTDTNGEIYYEKFPLNEGTRIMIKTNTLRPATQEEVLALVYQPNPLAEESKTAPKQEDIVKSDRLKELVLNNKAEVLVENEQEFRLIYDFLDKNCDKDLNRYLESDGSFDYSRYYGKKYPIVVFAKHYYRNIYEWNYLKNRNESKVLVKYNGETFSEERL